MNRVARVLRRSAGERRDEPVPRPPPLAARIRLDAILVVDDERRSRAFPVTRPLPPPGTSPSAKRSQKARMRSPAAVYTSYPPNDVMTRASGSSVRSNRANISIPCVASRPSTSSSRGAMWTGTRPHCGLEPGVKIRHPSGRETRSRSRRRSRQKGAAQPAAPDRRHAYSSSGGRGGVCEERLNPVRRAREDVETAANHPPLAVVRADDERHPMSAPVSERPQGKLRQVRGLRR